MSISSHRIGWISMSVALVALASFWLFEAGTWNVLETRTPTESAGLPNEVDDSLRTPSALLLESQSTRESLEGSTPLGVVGDVRSEDGNPIQGATVICYSESDEMIVCEVRTNPEGIFETRIPWGRVSRVEASAAGYTPDSRILAVSSQDGVHLVLESEVVVRGRVMLVDGNPPRSSVEVVAWRASSPDPTRRDIQAGRSATVSTARVTTSDDGRFVLRGLRRGSRYHVSAGGNGYADHLDHDGVEGGDFVALPDATDIEIVVAPLYGISIQLTGPEGTALPSSRFVNSYPGISIDLDESAVALTSGYLPGVRINAPLSEPLDDHMPDPSRRTWYFTSPVDAETMGPYRVRVSAPGFQVTERQLFTTRLRAPLTPAIIELTRTGQGFGNVVVKFAFRRGTTDSLVPDVQLLHAWGILYLVPRMSGATPPQQITLGLWSFGRDPIRFEGVPAQTYDVDYRVPFLSRGEDRQPLEIEVTPDTDCILEIPVVDHGAIEIDCVGDPERGPEADYNGRLSIVVRDSSRPNLNQFWTFARRPYCVYGLAPGMYVLEASNSSWKSAPESITVEADSVSRSRALLILAK